MNRKGFCVSPFRYAEFRENGDVWQCCINWIPKPMGNILTDDWDNVWNSKDAIELRESMHDGSMKLCDETQCPYLQSWNRGEEDYTSYFPIYDETSYHKLYNAKEINPTGEKKYKEIIEKKLTHLKWGPESIAFSHDRSCNLSCPSCRLELFKTSGDARKKSYEIQDIILGKSMCDSHEIYITSSGDPFGADIFRDLLKSISKEKYPNLTNLHLHTNAIGWTRKQWQLLSNLNSIPRITAEISIDAATKETYEQVRRGGKWELLLENLKFIFSEISNLEFVRMTFVTQDSNYKEMNSFVDLAEYLHDLNGMITEVNFGQINNWGTWSDSEFKNKKIMDTNHSEYLDFQLEYEKLIQRKKESPVKITVNF
jgi:hypothetical protein